MKCTSRSITLLANAVVLSAAGNCVLVEGPRIRAGDLATQAPAFAAVPPDSDFGPAPMGTMIRIFTRVQLAALLSPVSADLPDRLCVQRKREPIDVSLWQAAIDDAMSRSCGSVPWHAKVVEYPRHRFPQGVLSFAPAGFVAGPSPIQLWRGTLTLADKGTVPVWVRLEVRVQRSARIALHAIAAGATLSEADFQQEQIWSNSICKESPHPWPAIGTLAKQAIPSGAEITRENVRRPPAVRRGQAIELEAGTSHARLRMPAVAEHDAEIGEKVQVKSGWNGSRLTGTVVGTQKARVE